MFDVVLAPSASAFYEAADRPLALKLARCFRHLEEDPRRGIYATALATGEFSIASTTTPAA